MEGFRVPELWVRIFENLWVDELRVASRVCKEWQEWVLNLDRVWVRKGRALTNAGLKALPNVTRVNGVIHVTSVLEFESVIARISGNLHVYFAIPNRLDEIIGSKNLSSMFARAATIMEDAMSEEYRLVQVRALKEPESTFILDKKPRDSQKRRPKIHHKYRLGFGSFGLFLYTPYFRAELLGKVSLRNLLTTIPFHSLTFRATLSESQNSAFPGIMRELLTGLTIQRLRFRLAITFPSDESYMYPLIALTSHLPTLRTLELRRSKTNLVCQYRRSLLSTPHSNLEEVSGLYLVLSRSFRDTFLALLSDFPKITRVSVLICDSQGSIHDSDPGLPDENRDTGDLGTHPIVLCGMRSGVVPCSCFSCVLYIHGYKKTSIYTSQMYEV